MELRSLENNLLQVKPASDILTNKFEVTSNQNNIIFFFNSYIMLWKNFTTPINHGSSLNRIQDPWSQLCPPLEHGNHSSKRLYLVFLACQ